METSKALQANVEDAFEDIFGAAWNEDKDHTHRTVERWISAMQDLTTPKAFNFTTFPAKSQEMIIVRDIPVFSLCSHHVIPYYGHAHVAYVPKKHICGLSKLGRTVERHMRALTVQEELTACIADDLVNKLSPRGVAVVIEAEHLCVAMRGVQQLGTVTTTSALRGVFLKKKNPARAEFLSLIGRK